MDLSLDRDLQTPESILDWIKDLNVSLDIQELDQYPARPLIFSDYTLSPPTIIIYRYMPMDDWLNLVSQRSVGYYGPWYFLHIVYRLYIHLELNGFFEIEPKWYHRFLGQLNTVEARAYQFVREVLSTQRHPARFDTQVAQSFQPGNPNLK